MIPISTSAIKNIVDVQLKHVNVASFENDDCVIIELN